MADPPKKPPSEEPDVTLEKLADDALDKLPDAAMKASSALGLSTTQHKEVVKKMLRRVRRVGCPVHIQRLEVVHDAFVTAIAKPISERPSITNWIKFVAWMSTLAEYATLTNRNDKDQWLLSQGHSDEEIDALLPLSSHEDRIAARELLQKAWPRLKPDDREMLESHYLDEKTIAQIAIEKEWSPSTASWHFRRANRRLLRILKSLVALVILFFTKNVRAQGVRLAHHAVRLLSQAMPTASAMTVTVMCGVIVPASPTATVDHDKVPATTLAVASKPTVATAMVPAEPPEATEVEPVKPSALDELEKQWSDADMSSSMIARYLQATILPTALLVTPAVTQVACAGAEQRPTGRPQELEVVYQGPTDPYVQMCGNETRRGADCPSKAEWCAEMGKRPAAYGCE